MVMSFLKKLLGGGAAPEVEAKAAPGAAAPVARKTAPPAAAAQADLEKFVDFVVRALVDKPELVQVKTVQEGPQTTLQIACDKPDIGKVIGKSGKTIAAIRNLVVGAAGKLGTKVNVEVLD